MNILESVLNAGGGGAASQIAKSLGMGESQAQSAIGQLLPVLARGLSNNASTQEGLGGLLGALGRGNHQRYLDDPGILGHDNSVQEGNGILGHIFGSKDVSRQVASRTAEKTGIGSDLIKKMLPMVATMAMGALSKQASSSGMLGAQATPQQANGLGSLASFLDFDKDGSIADDLLGLVAKRFFS
ncbi:MAG: DUF937 domain-containing protein [Nitrospirales bacterium]